MKKLMLILTALTIVGGAFAAAVPVVTTLPAGTLAITNETTIASQGAQVEFVALQNDSSFSNAVTVTSIALDGAVSLATLYTGTLTAGATATVYPVRAFADGNTTNRPYVVSGVRVTVTSASGKTNALPGTVRTLFQSSP